MDPVAPVYKYCITSVSNILTTTCQYEVTIFIFRISVFFIIIFSARGLLHARILIFFSGVLSKSFLSDGWENNCLFALTIFTDASGPQICQFSCSDTGKVCQNDTCNGRLLCCYLSKRKGYFVVNFVNHYYTCLYCSLWEKLLFVHYGVRLIYSIYWLTPCCNFPVLFMYIKKKILYVIMCQCLWLLQRLRQSTPNSG